jgi:flavin-dependent dehydrogenase
MAKRVVIVGGGSSGWMTAAYLGKALQDVDITLVESPAVPIIGVGEATFSTVKLFFDFLELEESDWMPACNASYKLAIKFIDWKGDGGHFYHPFQRYEVVDGYNLGEWWLQTKQHEEAFDEACFLTPALCEARRSPRFLDGTVFDDKVQDRFARPAADGNSTLAHHRLQYPFAYHFDAALLARFLRDYAMARGVRQVVDNVDDVILAEDGSIAAVQTHQHGALAGDLFVDCTGFRGLLVNRALDEPFVSFGGELLCDRAVALRVPLDDRAQRSMEPFTTARAMPAGWIWTIPLYGRIGTGHVYSSAFLAPEEAERQLRAQVGARARDVEANHIRMRIGRCRNSWVRNCVAIGLASGFVEPLESTGIFFIQHGIEALVRHFPGDTIEPEAVRSYNRQVAGCIDGVRDFLVLHYWAAARADTDFWRAAKQVALPEVLAERLPLWAKRLPDGRNINPQFHGFEAYSYSVMLLGLTNRPPASLPVLSHLDPSHALAAFRNLRSRAESLRGALPSVYEYLTHMRGERAPGLEKATAS